MEIKSRHRTRNHGRGKETGHEERKGKETITQEMRKKKKG